MIIAGALTLRTGRKGMHPDSRLFYRIYIKNSAPIHGEIEYDQNLSFNSTKEIRFHFGSRPKLNDIQFLNIYFHPIAYLGFIDSFSVREIKLEVYGDKTYLLYHSKQYRTFEGNSFFSTDFFPSYSSKKGILLRAVSTSNLPIYDAVILADNIDLGKTDDFGEKYFDDFSYDIRDVFARIKIHEQRTYRDNHKTWDSTKNWNYRVYATNLEIPDSGISNSISTKQNQVVTLSISEQNTIIGINLLVSIEWPISDSDILNYYNIMNNASDVLFNSTDGQFFIDHFRIVHSKKYWNDADIRVYANINQQASVRRPGGQFLGWNILGSRIKVGRNSSAQTYIHEFGHYGMNLRDEYESPDGSPNMCSRTLSVPGFFGVPFPFSFNGVSSSCIMNDEFNTRKFCSNHPSSPHNKTTEQGETACWDEIKKHYSTENRWQLKSPDERITVPGTIMDRSGIPLSFSNFSFILPRAQFVGISTASDPNFINRITLIFIADRYSFLPRIPVSLRSRIIGHIPQGYINNRNNTNLRTDFITIIGAYKNDRILFIVDNDWRSFTITGPGRVEIYI